MSNDKAEATFHGGEDPGLPYGLFANPDGRSIRHSEAAGGGPTFSFGPIDQDGWCQTPTRSHDNDAGWDLYTSEQVVIPPGEFRDLPTNVWVALPDAFWGLVTGRSSALRKHGLLVHSGVIDAGYRGELYAGAFNLSSKDVVVEQGQRFAQFIPIMRPNMSPWWIQGDPPPGTRGTAGFGSTGN
ncbi:deoxyuridine triphosphatase [Gordonia phage Archimedes]|uniref:dUTP diphosphatase n=1 Tax=Gordonia phage Archimedes TaxID=2759389 RepID=A0A7L7STD7_9CAUD|nr:deoxyuridine triphosphatase [Gordonia phage Archimedes]QOC55755.1 deoxyuridine triphosphatase [Gordonia phage Archimedes]